MSFELPNLPYNKDALVPHISAETLDYHHGKHHMAYINNLNNLTQGTPWAEKSLEEIITSAPEGPIFNNAAQVYNHTFYWSCLGPGPSGDPSGQLDEAMQASFGSFAAFKEQFTKAAVGHFGSGWAWLVKEGGKLSIETTANANCPLRQGRTPLLTCDVWEHAYYIDYRNARPKYVEAFWNLVNWPAVGERLG